MKATAQSYYSNLTAGIPTTHIELWEHQISDAEANRLSQPAKMDIMGTAKPTETLRDADKNVPTDGRLFQALSLALSIEEKQ